MTGGEMANAALVLLSVNFLLMLSLPFVFFERRDGRLNAMWCITAAPFVICPVVVTAAQFDLVAPFVAPSSDLGRTLIIIGALMSASSMALIASSLSVHKVPPSQWHQENDAPRELVTSGPYGWIRHPFYSGYLLAFVAAALISPTLGTVAVLVYAAIMLNYTAAREEKRLANSELGAQYLSYIERTGRFVPRLQR